MITCDTHLFKEDSSNSVSIGSIANCSPSSDWYCALELTNEQIIVKKSPQDLIYIKKMHYSPNCLFSIYGAGRKLVVPKQFSTMERECNGLQKMA